MARIPGNLKVLASLTGLVPAFFLVAFAQGGCPPSGYPITLPCVLEMVGYLGGVSGVIGLLFGLGRPASGWQWALWINLVAFLFLLYGIVALTSQFLRVSMTNDQLYYLISILGLVVVSFSFALLGAHVGSRIRLRRFFRRS